MALNWSSQMSDLCDHRGGARVDCAFHDHRAGAEAQVAQPGLGNCLRRIVEVVVPSPATSLVLIAASFSSCAAIF